MSSSQARGWRSPPVHKNETVLRRTGGHSSSVRLPLFAPYPSTRHSSVDHVVSPYETPPLLSCLRLVRAFTLSTSRACNEVHVWNGFHRTDIRLTSGDPTLHACQLPQATDEAVLRWASPPRPRNQNDRTIQLRISYHTAVVQL